MGLTDRLATRADLPSLRIVMDRAIDQLQKDYLNAEQIAASRAFMGIDTQLIVDGTYFIVEENGRAAGCGGWSRRATLYGGDHSNSLREPRLLDPQTEAARVRAMYTDPDFVRRGIGRLILGRCETAALVEGFSRVELMATLAGEPLYAAAGYRRLESVSDRIGGVAVPLLRMGKDLT